jgi:formyltetrahydrofolate hydrolase
MSTQYDLGATFYKIGLIQDYGQTQSNNLKVALKILFEELYLKLFIERKDFEKEFVLMVTFNELELLEKISGLLKLIDHIDLAIEVEKKLDNITTVDNYFNRWMMKYHRLNSESDQKTIASICEKAIEYFTTKF